MPTKIKATVKPTVNRSQAIRDYLAANPGTSPPTIVAALKKKGIVVSLSLANQIRYAKPKGSIKKAPSKTAASKPSGSRSQAIRDFIAANPNAGPSEIRRKLKARGINVSASLVGAVKYRKTSVRPKATGSSQPSVAAGNGAVNVNTLLAAKAFVTRVGGVAAARKAIDLLAQLS